MQKETKKYLVIGGVLFLLFIVFTVMVKTIDVQPIGPENSLVGFAKINNFVFNYFGVNLFWYHLTDWLGVIAVLVALLFAILGFIQLWNRKRIRKVDTDIIALGVFYIIVAICYVFFELYVVNYRPTIIGNGLEPSYPSSHAMIVLCIMVTAMIQCHLRIKKGFLRNLIYVLSTLLIGVTLLGRLISGVHWFSDILAGLLLGASLCMMYYAVVRNQFYKERDI